MGNDNGLPAANAGISLPKILFVFLKIGTFTFGGGYAILPIIQKEIIHRLKWVDADTFMDALIVTQSLPGSVALSCSIIIGRRLRGTAGGLVAALGIVIPSFLTILLLAALLLPVVKESKFVEAVFYGLRPAVAALVASVAWGLGKEFIKNRFTMIIFVLLLIASLGFCLHPIFILVLGALLGLFFFPKNDL